MTQVVLSPLPTAVQWSHRILESRLVPGLLVVDATAGNGHDTLFLAQAVQEQGHVYAFDIQEQAISSTHKRLVEAKVPASSYTLIQQGHETMAATLPSDIRGQIAVVMFNLGYLPGGDKACITVLEHTLSAIQQALEWLMEGGLLTVVVYPGHAGGDKEAEVVEQTLSGLSSDYFEVQKLAFLNYRTTTPFLMVVRKRTWKKARPISEKSH